MKKLHADGLLESFDYESLDACVPCLMGKITKTPFSGKMEQTTNLLEIIHTNVYGPTSVEARGGYRYFLTFTDDLSRHGYIYLMKHKSETFVWHPGPEKPERPVFQPRDRGSLQEYDTA